MKPILIAALILAAAPCFACLWDYDTLAQESAGMPDIKAVIAGGFPRNPPLYYQMRLERVTRLIAENPDDLDAYDAAGVACDRLGRHDEAIEWMAKKRAAMERMGYDASRHAQPNHSYRYLANLGTFHAHRWFSKGANREDMTDMERGRELIAEAIKENPDAHFGREKYQLMAMEWIINLTPYDQPYTDSEGRTFDSHSTLPNMLGLTSSQTMNIKDNDGALSELGLDGSIDGLAGLIVMGNAWESVDVFFALALAIQTSGRSSLAALAMERCFELIEQGGQSIVPGAPTGQDLNEHLRRLPLFHSRLSDTGREVGREYRRLRKLADQWHEARTQYLEQRLKEGIHPDTDADFWADFEGNPHRMEIPSQKVKRFYDNLFGWMDPSIRPFGITILLILAVLLIWTAYKFVRVIQRKEPFGRARSG
jgi:tetratricopeptide (TPR) repeat protein